MANINSNNAQPERYDPRWFIWTIVFLVCTGVALTTYITVTSNNADVDSTSVRRVISQPKK